MQKPGDRLGASTGDVAASALCLADMSVGQGADLVAIALPDAEAEALMERGVVPGCRFRLLRKSPFGDPIIHVDGTVLALRREMARRLFVQLAPDVGSGGNA